MAESKVSCCLVPTWNIVPTRKQRVWARRKVAYDLQGLFPSELFPLSRPQLLKVQYSPKIEPPAGNQVWKHMNLWETFHTQTVIPFLWFRYVCKDRVIKACSVAYGARGRRQNITSRNVTQLEKVYITEDRPSNGTVTACLFFPFLLLPDSGSWWPSSSATRHTALTFHLTKFSHEVNQLWMACLKYK